MYLSGGGVADTVLKGVSFYTVGLDLFLKSTVW